MVHGPAMPVSDSRKPLRSGIGWRGPHHASLLQQRPAVGWLEVHAENYMGGGAPLHYLRQARRDWPVALHAVGLGLGGAEPPDPVHLERLAHLAAEIEPYLVSEHLAWSHVDGRYYNDLLPLPYNEQNLLTTCRNVSMVMDRLKRPILIENPATYLRFTDSSMSELDFLCELVQRTGCGLLCDVNNIYVSSFNHIGAGVAKAVAETYLDALPRDAVHEIHLAGHTESDADGHAILIDDHGSIVPEPVWQLYRHAVALFPKADTLVEWDSDLPPLSALVAEADLANRHRAAALSAAGISGVNEMGGDEQAA